MKPLFVRSLGTKANPVRAILLQILDLTPEENKSESFADLFGHLYSLDAMKLDIESERVVSQKFVNLKLEVQADKYSTEEIKILTYFLLGYCYNRLSTIQDALQD